ncbi:S-methyl-5-thioribose-1-phosphate isomerase [Woodsholea maritima]|uniref:S-methyl-5-thioribose-1-phosphate isomerase n=1 Tax=Woodsholea maritima TaxID=240237 RepID=UPI00036C23C1|nr:S-methyl-5-thioribose-1-phosphate isomerase [Woodsholea maritima]
MKINGTSYRSIWVNENGWSVHIFDQRALPWRLDIVELTHIDEAARAIKEMWTRGAPLLAMTGAYGLALALRADPSDANLDAAYNQLVATRPTAVNLKWALDQMKAAVAPYQGQARIDAAYAKAQALCDEDVATNSAIGDHGLEILRALHRQHPDRAINILTHCNAGWLATVDYGTATAPIYRAHDEGIPVHVWVDETRPRNQGALLTAYELAEHGVPHTLICDNSGGLLMQQGKVDAVIVGTDRVTANGDVCNKIGTYLKALAAKDNGVPFYVALPFTTFDANLASGADIPIEERDQSEVTHIDGLGEDGQTLTRVRLTQSPAANPAFDITPARLVTAFITERGVLDKPL